MRNTHATDDGLRTLINKLNKQKEPLFHSIARNLSRPRRIRREVNLLRINKHTKDGDAIIVPGKVLSLGDLDHKVDVFALSFSENAKTKIEKLGSTNTIEQAIGKKGLRIIG